MHDECCWGDTANEADIFRSIGARRRCAVVTAKHHRQSDVDFRAGEWAAVKRGNAAEAGGYHASRGLADFTAFNTFFAAGPEKDHVALLAAGAQCAGHTDRESSTGHGQDGNKCSTANRKYEPRWTTSKVARRIRDGEKSQHGDP